MADLSATAIPYSFFSSGQSAEAVTVRRFKASGTTASGRRARLPSFAVQLSALLDPAPSVTAILGPEGRAGEGESTIYVPGFRLRAARREAPAHAADEVTLADETRWVVRRAVWYAPSNGAVAVLGRAGL